MDFQEHPPASSRASFTFPTRVIVSTCFCRVYHVFHENRNARNQEQFLKRERKSAQNKEKPVISDGFLTGGH